MREPMKSYAEFRVTRRCHSCRCERPGGREGLASVGSLRKLSRACVCGEDRVEIVAVVTTRKVTMDAPGVLPTLRGEG